MVLHVCDPFAFSFVFFFGLMYGTLPFFAMRFLLDRYAESATNSPKPSGICLIRFSSMGESCFVPLVTFMLSMANVSRSIIVWSLMYVLLLPFLIVNQVSYLFVEKPVESAARPPF
jgi:hypothetical protein